MDLLLTLDKAIGNGVEWLVRTHHARRLCRIGWARALSPPDSAAWAAGDPPPRSGCSLEVLVDGADALARLAEELEGARSHVHIAGWFVSPDFALTRGAAQRNLRELLAGLAEDLPVRVLVWWPLSAGSISRPTTAIASTHRSTRPATVSVGTTRSASCKGLSSRTSRSTFGVAGTKSPAPGCLVPSRPRAPAMSTFNSFARFRNASTTLRRKATSASSSRTHAPCAPPSGGRGDTRGQLADLIECDDGGGRVLACTVCALGAQGLKPVYVHAKIGIVDDRWLTIGSANLNEHSLFNDTEVNVVTRDADLARGTRLRLWSEHLEGSVADVSADPTRVVDELWKPIAAEQDRRRRAGLQPSHHLSLLPDVSRRSRRLLGPVNGLLVDG